MNKTLVGLAIAVVALVVGVGGYFFPQIQHVAQNQYGNAGTLQDCTTQNGVETCAVTQLMTATSSSVCVINNPFGAATSTVDYFTASIASSSATGLGLGVHLFDLSTTTAAGGFGSSSPALIYAHSLADSATADTVVWNKQVLASTTAVVGTVFTDRGGTVNGVSPFFIKGAEKLTYRIATSSQNTFSTYFQGSCKARFTKVN